MPAYRIRNDFSPNWVTTCKLADHTIRQYDVAHDEPGGYDPKVFAYIGQGIIWTVDNVRQSYDFNDPADWLYFYVRRF